MPAASRETVGSAELARFAARTADAGEVFFGGAVREYGAHGQEHRVVLFGAAAVAVAWTATTQYSFYPQLSVPAPWPGYVVYAAWMVLPCVLHAIDEKRFG